MACRMILLTLLVASMAGGTRAQTTSVLDWSACGQDTICNAAGSCLTIPPDAEKMDQLQKIFKPPELNTSGCALMVQARNLVSKTVYLIEIMRPDLADRGKGQQVEVLLKANTDNPSLLVGCKANGDRVELIAADGYIADYKIELFEKLSFFDENHIICAFSIERINKMENDLPGIVGPETIGLRYRTKNASIMHQSIPETERNLLFPGSSCDPFAFQDSPLVEGFKIQPVRNRYRNRLNCDKYDDSYELHYQYKTQQDGLINVLKCEQKKWMIESANGTSSGAIEDIEEYFFWCASKFSQSCTKPLLHCEPPHCPSYTAGTNASDALLTCPGGKWRMEWPTTKKEDPEVEYYANLTVECKEHDVLQNEAAFFYTINEAEQQLPETASCFTEYNCEEHAGLFYSDCDATIETCRELDRSNGTMQCKQREGDKTTATLTVIEAGSNSSDSESFAPFTASFYTCDTSDGQWKDDGGRAIPRFFSVSCEVEPKEEEEVGMATLGKVGIGFIAAGMILFCGLCGVCGTRKYRKNTDRIAVRKVKVQAWKKMKPAARLRHARFVFSKIREKRLDFKHAFDLIEMALDTETEDLEVWEEFYNFISVLQGTLTVVEFGMLGMLNRYLYTQGKRIIEKHGWLSPHRITKSNPKGLIRVIGIKLLLRSMLNSKECDAEELLLEGAMYLSKGQHASEQYPHCGVMWQALTQVHFERRTTKTAETAGNYWDDRNAYWYKETFLKMLGKYFSENSKSEPSVRMEDGDVIAAFGAPREQAAEALGAAESDANHKMWSDAFFNTEADPDLLRRYMRGLENSLSTDIGRHFIPQHFKDKSVYTLRDMLKLPAFAFMNEQIDRWMRTLIAHNRSLDAHYLDKRLRTDKEFPGDKFFEMKKAHERFVDYTKEQSEEIREWLSERIPIDDLNVYFEKGVRKIRKREFKPPKPEKQSKNGGGAKPLPPCKLDPNSPFKALAGAPRSEWKKVPIVRPKTSPLTPTEREKYMGMVEATFAAETVLGARMHYSASDVIEVTRKTRDLVRLEPLLIEDVTAPVIVIGDLHGQLYELDRIFRTRARDGKPGYLCDKYLILGDYVDRGPQCLEVLMSLFMLKLCYPDNFILLRGNHEFAAQNHHLGFRDELGERYPKDVDGILYVLINETFYWLSISAIINDTFYCTHACLSANSFSRHAMRALHKPIIDADETVIVQELVWNDPMECEKGTTFNTERHAAAFVGVSAMALSLFNVGCKYLFRGHEKMKHGFSVAQKQVLTTFTNTWPTNSAAAIVLSAKLSISMLLLSNVPARPCINPEKEKKDEKTIYGCPGTGVINTIKPFEAPQN